MFIFSEEASGGAVGPGPGFRIVAAGVRVINPDASKGQTWDPFMKMEIQFVSPDNPDEDRPLKQSYDGIGYLDSAFPSEDGESPAIDVNDPEALYDPEMLYPYLVTAPDRDARPTRGSWKFFESLANAGFDLGKLEEAKGFEPLVGLTGEIIHIDEKVKKGKDAGKINHIPVFASLENPDGGEAKGGKSSKGSKSSSKGGGKASAAKKGDDDLSDEDKIEAMDAVIAAGPEFASAVAVSVKAFGGALKGKPNAKAQVEFLKGIFNAKTEDGTVEIGDKSYVIVMDGKSVTVAEG